jgi:hypothetical protein
MSDAITTGFRGEECRLEGGPSELPEERRSTTVDFDENKVKVMFGNGWEHFERDSDFTSTGVPIFRWTMTTKVAE